MHSKPNPIIFSVA